MRGLDVISRWIADCSIDDRFLYDGTRINDDDTPTSLDMEDNGTPFLPLLPRPVLTPALLADTIDVMVERELTFVIRATDGG